MSFLGYEQTNNLVEPYLEPVFLEDIMSDFDGAKPIKTVRDNDAKFILADGASGSSATKLLSIVAPAEAFGAGNSFGIPMMVKDALGNAQILELPLAIRPLVFATDTVDVSGSSVSISGNVTVDATNLDIRDLVFATDKVDVSGSSVTIPNLTFATDTVDVSGSSVTVSATNLDIRDLTHVSDSVKVGDGTDFLAINADGSINVNVKPAGGKVCDYHTSATVGVGSEVLHMYPVTNAKLFTGNSLLVGARGAVQVRFGISTDGIAASTVKGVYFQDPKENRGFEIDCLELLGDGTKAIFIGITNRDAASSDVYSTLQGYEV